MYQLDSNINTAMQRQADQVRAVKAYGSREASDQAGPSYLTLLLAVAAPIALLLVLGVVLH